MFGLTAQGQLLELSRAMLAGETETALRALNELASHGKDLGRLLGDLLNHFRNLLIYKVARGDPSMLEISEAEAAALAEQSKMASTEGATRILEALGEGEWRLRDAVSKKISMEITLLKAIEARNAVSLDSVLQHLQALREGAGHEIVSLPQPEASPSPLPGFKPIRAEAAVVTPAPATPPSVSPVVREQTTATPPLSLDSDLTDLWNKLLEAVGRVSQFTRTYLLEAHPVSFTNHVLTIGFDPEFEDHIGLVDNARNHSLLQTKLLELGHASAQIKFIKAEQPVRRPAAAAEAPATQAAATAPRATGANTAASAAAPTTKEKTTAVPFDNGAHDEEPETGADHSIGCETEILSESRGG